MKMSPEEDSGEKDETLSSQNRATTPRILRTAGYKNTHTQYIQ